jgi:hypothetical protein
MSFRREWNAATEKPRTSGFEGAWAGTWKSDVNGHHGKLRCVVGPAKNAEGAHDFHYHATWAGFLSGAYRAEHQVTPGRKECTFTGIHDMPKAVGGRYTYGGTIRGDEFSACYQCAMDKGTFQMQRVK